MECDGLMKNNNIVIINMTKFFNRELFMYAISDFKFSKPKSLKYIGYTALALALWSLPFVLIFKIATVTNPYFAMFVFIPPFVIGHYASQPIWGGRGLIDFIQVYSKYLAEPKAWADYNGFKPKNETYYVKQPLWVSRRREYQYLAELKEKRINELKKQNRIKNS